VDADLSQLDALAARLRKVDKVGTAIAQDAMPKVLDEAKRTAAAGTTADGKAWQARRKDGGRPLANAAAAISAAVSGLSVAVIVLVLRGVEVIHHRSKLRADAARGLPRRAILFDPANGVPPKMREAIATSAKRVVAREIGGGS
jgi:UDP-N-acetylmuramyl pentapeptide synthase